MLLVCYFCIVGVLRTVFFIKIKPLEDEKEYKHNKLYLSANTSDMLLRLFPFKLLSARTKPRVKYVIYVLLNMLVVYMCVKNFRRRSRGKQLVTCSYIKYISVHLIFSIRQQRWDKNFSSSEK